MTWQELIKRKREKLHDNGCSAVEAPSNQLEHDHVMCDELEDMPDQLILCILFLMAMAFLGIIIAAIEG